jgi:hypothetical protein
MTRDLGVAATRLSKLLERASYPTANTFEGVIRDKGQTFSLKITPGNLDESTAYSQATRNRSKGDVTLEANQADTVNFYGSGILGSGDGMSEAPVADRYASGGGSTILEWYSCKQGYVNMPGFSDRPPRCASHRLFLRNRKQVKRAGEKTYQFFQDLLLETRFSISANLTSPDYNAESGSYSPGSWIEDPSNSSLLEDEKSSAGVKLIAPNVATVSVKTYDTHSSARTIEIEMIAVYPVGGQAEVRKTFKQNIGVEVWNL